MPYRLLTQFQDLFDGRPYIHRDSSLGDRVAMQLVEDIVAIPNPSAKLVARIDCAQWAMNTANRRQGVRARRGDGTFGEVVPHEATVADPGYRVHRGPVATVEIGSEVKILAKAMIKQIDRVIGDLQKQVTHFRKGGGNPLCVGIVGINRAEYAVGYEGERSYRTDGRKHKHPIDEASEAEDRLLRDVAPVFDEFIILRYLATNDPPYPFKWHNLAATERDYGASLVRLSHEYDSRF